MDKFHIWFIILHIVFFVNKLQCFDTLVCENDWELREGKCYRRIEVSSQTQGVQLCSDVNGLLIMPKTAIDNAIVMELLQLWGFSRMWIGLANNYGNNEYIWEDGTKLIDTGYTNWRIGEPNGAEPMCVEFYQAGWNDNPCNRFFTVVCQKDAATAMCPCQCAYRRKLEYWASKIAPNKTLNELLKDLQPVIQKIKVDLTVEKSKLSLEINKHISTVDNRKSSQTIGVLGAVLIIIVLGVILAIEFSTLLYHFKSGCSSTI